MFLHELLEDKTRIVNILYCCCDVCSGPYQALISRNWQLRPSVLTKGLLWLERRHCAICSTVFWFSKTYEFQYYSNDIMFCSFVKSYILIILNAYPILSIKRRCHEELSNGMTYNSIFNTRSTKQIHVHPQQKKNNTIKHRNSAFIFERNTFSPNVLFL